MYHRPSNAWLLQQGSSDASSVWMEGFGLCSQISCYLYLSIVYVNCITQAVFFMLKALRVKVCGHGLHLVVRKRWWWVKPFLELFWIVNQVCWNVVHLHTPMKFITSFLVNLLGYLLTSVFIMHVRAGFAFKRSSMHHPLLDSLKACSSSYSLK